MQIKRFMAMMMGRTVYSKEKKKQAYEMYWTDRKPFTNGHKLGRYSLSEISRVTGMSKSYISRIGRLEN